MNLTNKIKKRIADYENDVAVEDESLDTHRKPMKVNSEEQLAKAITAKLEDGNFKAALRLKTLLLFQVWKPEMLFLSAYISTKAARQKRTASTQSRRRTDTSDSNICNSVGINLKFSS